MKRAYTFALAGALALAPLALPGAAEAQERAVRPGGGHGAGILALRAELGLTPEQEQQLTAIAERLRAQNQPLIEQLRASGAMQHGQRPGAARRGPQGQGSMTPEQRAEMRERMQNMTPEQRQAMRAQMREGMGERARDLTPEQREQMRARMQERRAAGERGPRAERVPEELRPVVQQIRANAQAAMEQSRAVLTAEQQARLQELRQQRRPAAGERGQRGRGHRAPGAPGTR